MNLGKAAKKLLSSLAPTVGLALGGPVGAMTGKVLAAALDVPANQVNELLEANDPETAIKLMELENNFELEMGRLGIDMEKVHANDRASARTMADKHGLLPQIILSVVFTIGYFAVVVGLMTKVLVIPSESGTLISALIGVLTAGVLKVLDFFLGSSAGSKRKTDKLIGA